MPLIPETVIDEVLARVDLAELIGRYVPLKRAGRHFKANCPFHHERTPSFTVNTDRQIFHCFGCRVGGNAFGFLMRYDRMTFPEAVRHLAEHVGVRIPESGEPASKELHERLYNLMEKACRYFERMLVHPQRGAAARAYLTRRGVSERTARLFRVGLAPVGWRGLLAAARSASIPSDHLEAAGLVINGPSGAYDRFRHRLMFPIMDLRSRVVGFGGRSLDAQEPKYLNSPETPIYTKGRQLFGLAQAKEAVLKTKTAVIVEGYFDAVVLAEAGLSHVVSPQGTALTIEQARLLKRYAEGVILAFDADAAGEAAALRGMDLLIEVGLQVRVAQLPTGVDPDDYLRTYGRERLDALLARAHSIFEFLVDIARKRYPFAETEGKVRAAQFVLPTIAKIPDSMLRSEYVRLLAERLRLDEAAVAEELAKVKPRTVSAVPLRQGGRPPGARLTAHGPEQLLTALVVDDPSRWATVETAGVSIADVTDPTLRRVLKVLCEMTGAQRTVTPAQVAARLSESEDDAAVAELVALAQATTAQEEALERCIRRLQDEAQRRLLEQLRQQIHAAQEAGHDMEVQRLLAEYQARLKHSDGSRAQALAAVSSSVE